MPDGETPRAHQTYAVARKIRNLRTLDSKCVLLLTVVRLVEEHSMDVFTELASIQRHSFDCGAEGARDVQQAFRVGIDETQDRSSRIFVIPSRHANNGHVRSQLQL